MTDKPTCATCRFFDHQSTDAGNFGYCRVHPPVPYQGRTVWPIVDYADWCGAHPAFSPDPLLQIVDGKIVKVIA